MTFMEVTMADGRVLEYLTGGDPEGFPLVFHYGTPCAARPFSVLDHAAHRQGLRLIGYSRPGYGASTPRRWVQPNGPRVVDDVAAVAELLDGLGHGGFVTMGWSGGGPRAVGCATVLGPRCRAAAELAGPAPLGAEGLDWYAGMHRGNQDGFRLAQQGADAYRADAEEYLEWHRTLDGDGLLAELAELLTPSDRDSLTPEYAGWVADTFRGSVEQGVVGQVDDSIAEVSPWGFDPAMTGIPVIVWHGKDDQLVPMSHGAWLAERIPTAVPHVGEQEGHFTWAPQLDELLAELVDLADLAGV